VTLFVGEVNSKIDAHIILVKEFDNSEKPNGELKVVVNDTDNDGVGDSASNFNYVWYGSQNLVGEVLGTSQIMTGLGAGTYSVLVSDKTTGCYDSAYATIRIKEIVLGTDEDADLMGVSVYPNPGVDGFTVLIDNGYIGDVQLQLQSLLGNEASKTFFSSKDSRTLTVPIEALNLNHGVYVIEITLGKVTLRKKWIKLRD
jgi:hypothetical protein